MKRVLLVMIALLVIPGFAAATATLGAYIDGFLVSCQDIPVQTPFDAYLYIVQDEYEVTGIQYALETPSDPSHNQLVLLSVEYPFEASVWLGDPWNGHAISYSPPVSCYPYGYGMMVKYEFMKMVECPDMIDYQLVVVGHPDPGLAHPTYGSLYGTYSPDHEAFPIDGLTTVFCPLETDVQEESWGAIKSMYR